MSFRELRTLTETLRLLGYERPVSVESFRVPNVELVADIMYWLAKRYDPASDIAFDLEREQSRVMFFRSVCEAVYAKTRIKLSIKKLYQADGYAVQEMLKLALLLKDATRMKDDEPADHTQLQAMLAQRSHQEAKAVRQLCTELTSEGSNLFYLLEQELTARNVRSRVITRATEVSDVERRLRDMLSQLTSQIEQSQQSLTQLTGDEQTLEQKIESKKAQLDRAQKRLKSLLNVRPAFMEEYEKHEADLHQQFVVYLEQYRNLEYLEYLLAKFNKIEDEILAGQERKLKIMREQLRKEELRVLRGETATDDGVEFSANDHELNALEAAKRAEAANRMRADNSRNDVKRPRAASGRQRPEAENGVGSSGAVGNMYGGGGAGARGAAAGSGARGQTSDESDESDSDDDDSDDDESLSINEDEGEGGDSDSDGDSDDDSDGSDDDSDADSDEDSGDD